MYVLCLVCFFPAVSTTYQCVCVRAGPLEVVKNNYEFRQKSGIQCFLKVCRLFVSCPCERSGQAGIGFQFAVSHVRLLFVLHDEVLANEKKCRKRKRLVCFGLLVVHTVHTCTLGQNHIQASTRSRKADDTWAHTRPLIECSFLWMCISC